MRRGLAPALGGLLLIVAALAAWWVSSAEPPPVPKPASSAPSTITAPTPQAASAETPAAPPQAKSWEGTIPDGAITLDERGDVSPDRALRWLFDYLLTAQGELTMAEIRERLAASGRALPLDAERQVQLMAFFQRYLDYLQALPQVRLQGSDAESLRRTAEARRALRRGILGVAMSEGFFAEEEARERLEVELAAIRENPALTPAARAEALAERRQQQTPADESAKIIDLAAETERLRAAGADAAAIQALREREVGSEAAARLAALDAERARWQQRVTAFRSERERLLADPAFAPEDRQRQLAALIRRDFDETEAVRLRAQLEISEPRAAAR